MQIIPALEFLNFGVVFLACSCSRIKLPNALYAYIYEGRGRGGR
jgi:hypothetical protein